MLAFTTDRRLRDLAQMWNATGPYHWEIRDSHYYDYLMTRVDRHGEPNSEGWKVKVYPASPNPASPTRYEIEVYIVGGETKVEVEVGRRVIDAVFRNTLVPAVRGTVLQ